MSGLRLRERWTNRRLARTAEALRRDFLGTPSAESLVGWLGFLAGHGLLPDLDGADLEQALCAVDWSGADRRVSLERLRTARTTLGAHLMGSADNRRAAWTCWLQMSKAAALDVEVADPAVAARLQEAKRRGAFTDLSDEGSTYLLTSYLHAFADVLDRSDDQDSRLLLPVLVEFAGIAQTLGLTEYSDSVLDRWPRQARTRPRSPAAFMEEEVFAAPLRGVGSPNGVSVTMYREGISSVPSRIAYAGMTPDQTLNAQLLAALFTTALSGDARRSFLTAAGGIVHLDPQHTAGPQEQHQVLLGVAYGPEGAAEPTAGMPTLDMSPKESFELVGELFTMFSEVTGLVSVTDWSPEDADALEEKIRSGLAAGTEAESATRRRRIRNEPSHLEDGAVVHVMPLLHRVGAEVRSVEIEVSGTALVPESVLRLTRTARQSHMGQLIAAARRRVALARQAHEEQDQAIRHWESLSRQQQEELCRAHPMVEVTQAYDFDLGLVTLLDEPKQIPRNEYEGVTRPQMRDSAEFYAKKFTVLSEKLEQLNRSGGTADALTRRWLVDGAIRGDATMVNDPGLRQEYEVWTAHVAAVLWPCVTEWATCHGYPIELLSADNILFDSAVSEDLTRVWIRPHVMLDLHDFDIVLDPDAGLMYAFPGGARPCLADMVLPSAQDGIHDPVSLHHVFCERVEQRYGLSETRSAVESETRDSLLADPRLAGLLLLEQGRRLLLNGEPERAVEVFRHARPFDLAAVYFWGAVAHQMQFLSEQHQFAVGMGGEGRSRSRTMHLLNAAIHCLVEELDPARRLTPHEGRPGAQFPEALVGWRLGTHGPVAPDALVMLDQLRARDPNFVAGLIVESPDIVALEEASLDLNPDEQDRLRSAVWAVSSLDFLALAEAMKTFARSLPLSGRATRQLRAELESLVAHARTLPLLDPPGLEQIRELTGVIGQS